MEIEFRDLASLASQGIFGFAHSDSDFGLGFWNHSLPDAEATTEIDFAEAHYGMVTSGRGELRYNNLRFELCSGMYFCVPGAFVLSGEFAGILMTNKGAHGIHDRGIFQIGGPVESEGRLSYIDGCSDSLLIPPPRLGMPCVNLLKIPAHTLQRFHTHPTFRFGVIIEGFGTCDSGEDSFPLEPGTVFHIPREGLHRFRTDESSLTVVAFHPDSDFGPDDSNHPMVNRTIVNGVSAARLSLSDRQVSSTEYRE